MVAGRTRTIEEDLPKDPDDRLLKESVLGLDEYIAMYAAVGHRTRCEICYWLVHSGAMSPKELEAAMTVNDSTLHYHLSKLVDAGLVEKRQRTERGQDCLYTYYRATVFGEVTLTDGVDKLIRGEQAFEGTYDSLSEP